MTGLTVAAVDLGAESGRVAAVEFDGDTLRVEIRHRFPHLPRTVDGWLHWDVDAIWTEVSQALAGLAASGAASDGARADVASVGVDAWGVDYALYAKDGTMLDDPVSYRDGHRIALSDEIIRELGAQRLYEATGTQLIEINTLFGLVADVRLRPQLLSRAARLLMLPDVFHHVLSGADVTEQTAASTSGLYDTAHRRWAADVIEAAGLPARLLPDIVPSGTDLGPVAGALAGTGLGSVRVIAPAAHDTASAVLTIPRARPDTLFISSGTWSLAGVVLDEPVLTAAAREANLTNELGYGGTVLFLRNTMGLWVLQECRRQWLRDGHPIDYETLVALAEAEEPLRSVVDLNATAFVTPGNMPARIRDHCRQHGMPVPETVGQTARVIVDALALSYRLTAEDIGQLTGERVRRVAVVGGGVRNTALQQATADALGLPVWCGAVEASVIGNAGAQLIALGELAGAAELRDIVRASVGERLFEPGAGRARTADWAAAAGTLRQLERDEAHRRGIANPGVRALAHERAGA